MSELKKKLDGARPHCLPRALVLINPGNPTGTLNVYRFVITCSNINADDDDDDGSNDNKIYLFTLDILFCTQVIAFELSFQGGDPYKRVFVIPGCWLYSMWSLVRV